MRAQEVNFESTVVAVKADLVKRGMSLSGSCGGFEITKRVAWLHRAEGAGLLAVFPPHTNCASFSVDKIMFTDGSFADVLVDGGGRNEPSWQTTDKGDVPKMVAPSLWRAPLDPGDGDVPVPVPPTPPTPTPSDLQVVANALVALTSQVEQLSALVLAAHADLAKQMGKLPVPPRTFAGQTRFGGLLNVTITLTATDPK